MKLLLLRLKYFFAQAEVRLFFRVLLISIPIVAVISYYAYPYLRWVFEHQERALTQQKMLEVLNMPRSTNSGMLYDQTHMIQPHKQETLNDEQFWNGDALQYRYTEPSMGKPKR